MSDAHSIITFSRSNSVFDLMDLLVVWRSSLEAPTPTLEGKASRDNVWVKERTVGRPTMRGRVLSPFPT